LNKIVGITEATLGYYEYITQHDTGELSYLISSVFHQS